MDRSTVIIFLALFTLLAGMAVAAVQVWVTDRAKKTGEHVDGTKARPNA